jgi:hypothetical protein
MNSKPDSGGVSVDQNELPTLKEIEAAILKSDPNEDRANESFKAQVVLLASASYGPNQVRLAKLTGYPRPLIAKFNHNLRRNGVWKNGKVHGDWSDGVGFMADVCVALGFTNRVS